MKEGGVPGRHRVGLTDHMRDRVGTARFCEDPFLFRTLANPFATLNWCEVPEDGNAAWTSPIYLVP